LAIGKLLESCTRTVSVIFVDSRNGWAEEWMRKKDSLLRKFFSRSLAMRREQVGWWLQNLNRALLEDWSFPLETCIAPPVAVAVRFCPSLFCTTLLLLTFAASLLSLCLEGQLVLSSPACSSFKWSWVLVCFF
jgi:hypothetical protein